MHYKTTYNPIKQSNWAYFMLAFITMSGVFYINFLPSVVNALVNNIGFNKIQAGQIVAFNGYGNLIGSIVGVFLVKRVPWQPFTFTLLALMSGLDIATVWVDNYSVMLVWRFLAGIMGGVSVGLTFSVLGRLKNPDRAFGFLLLLQFSLGSLVIYILSAIETLLGKYTVFYVMGCCSLISVLFICLLPKVDLKCNIVSIKMPVLRIDRRSFLLLFTIVLYLVAANAIWAYVSLIGEHAQINPEEIDIYIATTGFLGLFGAMFPVINSNRFGRMRPVIIGMIMSIIAAVLLCFSHIPFFYILAMGLLFTAWPAVHAYLLAASAQLDSSGRLSAITAVVSYLGLASGPLLGASLVSNNEHFEVMLYTCAGLFFISLLAFIKPLRVLEQTRTISNYQS